ncbi:MAG: hypothetical protein K2W82_14630 [Candidatus Obscuribacterales bacterium]|nr:hypothetical protein [Candidatus Obscuribacterales bacterium]
MFSRKAAKNISLGLVLSGLAGFSQNSVLAEESELSTVSLKGVVSEYVGPTPDELLERLLHTAQERDEQKEILGAKAKHYHGIMGKSAAGIRQVVQMATEYRGFEFSSEAADVILEEKFRLKSQSSVDFIQQKSLDEKHSKIFASLMQIAQAAGLPASDAAHKQKAVEVAMAPLKELVGEVEAKKAADSIFAWADQITVPESYFKQQSMDMMDLQSKSETLVKQSLQNDPVVSYARRALHNYNVHKNIVRASAKVINTTLSIAMFSPTVVAPAAQLAAFVYSMAAGGPEETKLLKELYLDKRLESRFKRVNFEIGQSMTAYNTAILTRNPVLLSFSESMMSAISSEDAVSGALGNKPLVAKKSTRNQDLASMQGHGVM